MKILLTNLPGEVTEGAIRAALEKFFFVHAIEISREGNEQAPTAIVDVVSDRMSAEEAAKKIHGTLVHGHAVQASVPVFFQDRLARPRGPRIPTREWRLDHGRE